MLPYWRLSAYYFFYFAFLGAFSPYFGLYLQDRGYSAWDIGVLMSVMQVMRIVAPNLWGWLADRRGARMPIVRRAGALAVLGFSGFFLADRFSHAFVAMALMAFFWSATLPLVEAVTLTHLAGQSERYGKIRMWGSIGFIVAVLGIGFVLDHLPLASLLWLILIQLAGVFLSALTVPEAPPLPHQPDHPPLGRVLRRREVALFLAGCFFMSAAHGALYSFYSIYLVEHGYGKSLVGALWSLGVAAEIGVFMLMPAVLQRHSAATVLALALGVAVLRFLLIGWCVDWLPALLLAQTLHGITFGAFHSAALAAVNHWFQGRLQARGQAIYSSVSFGAGGMIGGLVSGGMWQPLGGALTYSVAAGFAGLGLGLMLAGRK